MAVKEVFNQYASEYDGARRRLIPCFDPFYQTVTDLVPFDREKKMRVLDLGAGTGLLTAMMATPLDNAHFVLVDVAEKMLEQARLRLASFGNRFDYLSENYADGALLGDFDLVVSSLSIHHLEDEQKERLFKEIFQHLKQGGMFINADQVLGETPAIDEVYRNKWLSAVKQSGSSTAEIEAALERMKEDKMSSLSHQLGALKNAQFSMVNCWFQHYSFVVYSGRKFC